MHRSEKKQWLRGVEITEVNLRAKTNCKTMMDEVIFNITETWFTVVDIGSLLILVEIEVW